MPPRRRLLWKGGCKMPSLVPLMLVPLLIFAGFWAYLWNLDGKVKRLEEEMRRLEEADGE